MEIDDYLYYLDINSSYPSIMLQDLPNGEIEYMQDKKVWESWDEDDEDQFTNLNLYLVTSFYFMTRTLANCILPVSRKEGGLYYPFEFKNNN